MEMECIVCGRLTKGWFTIKKTESLALKVARCHSWKWGRFTVDLLERDYLPEELMAAFPDGLPGYPKDEDAASELSRHWLFS